MRVVRNLRGPTKHSRDILLQAKGITGIDHSDQMVLVMIRRGRLVR